MVEVERTGFIKCNKGQSNNAQNIQNMNGDQTKRDEPEFCFLISGISQNENHKKHEERDRIAI
jgi:hypothetical protein